MSRYSHDPTTHTLSLISGTNPDDYNFVGTTAEWEALTPAQKAQYESRDIIDDFNGDSIDSSPTYNSPHAVSSGGTYNAIKAVSDAIPTVDNIPTQGSSNPISSGAMFSALDDIDDEIAEVSESIQKIVKGTISGTTTASGNLITDVSANGKIPVCAVAHISNYNAFCLITATADTNTFMFRVLKVDGNAWTSTAVSIDYYYIAT